MKRVLLYLVPAAALIVVVINATLCRVTPTESTLYDPSVVAPSSAASAVTVSGTSMAHVASVGSVSAPTRTGYAPDFSWIGPDGKVMSLGSFKGKVVMINFWATWCPPCRRELPDLVKLREETESKGFEIIGITVSEQPQAGVSIEDHVAGFAQKNGLSYPLVIGNDRMIEAYGGIESIPTTVVVDREGKVAQVINGMMTADEMRQAIAPVL